MALYETIAFGLFALIVLASSLGVVLLRDVWHSALMLGVSLLSIAVHYAKPAAVAGRETVDVPKATTMRW